MDDIASPLLEKLAYEWFAGAHPNLAHAEDPEKFWQYFQEKCPGVSREAMEATLRETE